MSKNQDLGELINGIKSLGTNQLNAPAYTSASSFTGTLAGLLGFDSSGNVISLASTSLTLNSSQVTTALGFTPYNATNPSGYISGITSLMVTTALGYTPYNSSNPSGYISGINSGMVTSALGYTPVPTTRTITINGVTYDLSADRSWTVSGSGVITGSGTNNYVTKWTGTTSIGNSNIQDSSTLVSINSETYVNGLLSANKLILYGGPEMIRMYASTPFISFYDATNVTRFGYIQAYAGMMEITTDTGNALKFNISGTERMRILTNGNVGIGGTPSTGKLEIFGPRNTYQRITNTADSVILDLLVGSATNGAFIGTATNHPLRLATNDTERMRITSAGNVGIGTTNPSGTLEVAAPQYPFIVITGTNSTQIQAQYGVNQVLQAAYLGTNTNHPLLVHTNGSERMRIAAAGQVSIGTTAIFTNTTLYVRNGFRAECGGATAGDLQCRNEGGTSIANMSAGAVSMYSNTSGQQIYINNIGIAMYGLPTSNVGVNYVWRDSSGYLRIG